MECCDFQAVPERGVHRGGDLVLGERHVAHDDRLRAAPREGRPGREALKGLHLQAIDGNGEVGARDAHLRDPVLHLGLERGELRDGVGVWPDGERCAREEHLDRATTAIRSMWSSSRARRRSYARSGGLAVGHVPCKQLSRARRR